MWGYVVVCSDGQLWSACENQCTGPRANPAHLSMMMMMMMVHAQVELLTRHWTRRGVRKAQTADLGLLSHAIESAHMATTAFIRGLGARLVRPSLLRGRAPTAIRDRRVGGAGGPVQLLILISHDRDILDLLLNVVEGSEACLVARITPSRYAL